MNEDKRWFSIDMLVFRGGGCFLFLLFWGTPKDMDLRNAYV